MSIWRHLTDLELQSLKEVQQDIDEAEYELARTETAVQQQEARLHSAEKYERDFNEQRLRSAVGDDTPVLHTPTESVAEIRELVSALQRRQQELATSIAMIKRQFKAKAEELLDQCITRASIEYGETAEMLAEQWRELNAAQLALGQRELSWMHIFIPGLERMPEAREAYNRNSLFVGRDEASADDGALMGELEVLSA